VYFACKALWGKKGIGVGEVSLKPEKSESYANWDLHEGLLVLKRKVKSCTTAEKRERKRRDRRGAKEKKEKW